MATCKVSIVLPPIMEPKERILEKANELFMRYGIRSVSMNDIAVELGMSKKTLYQYYADKDELVNAVFETVFNSSQLRCNQSKTGSENAIHEVFVSFNMVQQMLDSMNPAVLFDLKKYHPIAYKKFQDFKNQFLHGLLMENLQKGVDDGLYRPEIDIEILSRYRLNSIMLCFDSDVFPSGKNSLTDIELHLMLHFLYGITTAKGQKLVQKYINQRSKK